MSEKLTLIPFELRLRSHGQNYNFYKENYISAGAENRGEKNENNISWVGF